MVYFIMTVVSRIRVVRSASIARYWYHQYLMIVSVNMALRSRRKCCDYLVMWEVGASHYVSVVW